MLPAGPAPGLFPAHGLGGAKDLPIPLGLAIAGATAALIVSFCVLALAWRTPRYQDVRPGRPVPAWLSDLVASPASSGRSGCSACCSSATWSGH